MKKNAFGQEARDKIKIGIDFACNAAKISIGPYGQNATLGRIGLPPINTNDGVSIVRNCELDDELENEGVWIVKEACSFASNKAKDGTTTTAVLLQAIIDNLFNKMKGGGSLTIKPPNGMALMKQVDQDCKKVVEKLKEKSRPISMDEIYNVAMVAGEHDWLAKIVSEVYEKIGKDGYVDIKEGNKTKYETFQGIELNAGYHSEYYINNDKGECVLENPYIVVTNNRIDDITLILPILAGIKAREENGLIIIAPDFGKDFLNRLNTAQEKFGETAVAIRLPIIDKDNTFKDIAALTGAKFLDKETYGDYEQFKADFKLENVGRTKTATIGDGRTLLIGGTGDTSARVEELRRRIADTVSIFDRDALEKRLAYLSGGVAIVEIGGDSDFEKTYFKLKAENAFAAAENSIKSGVVKGGGITLKEIGEEMEGSVLSEALKAPFKAIQENAPEPFKVPDNAVDALDTIVSSVQSACSLAGRTIATGFVTSFANDNKNKSQN